MYAYQTKAKITAVYVNNVLLTGGYVFSALQIILCAINPVVFFFEGITLYRIQGYVLSISHGEYLSVVFLLVMCALIPK
jgi:hypothetical protein